MATSRAGADANTEPVDGPSPRRTRRLRAFPWRLSLLLVALFAALTLLAGGAGLALGAISKIDWSSPTVSDRGSFLGTLSATGLVCDPLRILRLRGNDEGCRTDECA